MIAIVCVSAIDLGVQLAVMGRCLLSTPYGPMMMTVGLQIILLGLSAMT